jgi:hypothetical protein
MLPRSSNEHERRGYILNDSTKYVNLSWINGVGIRINGAPSVTGVVKVVVSLTKKSN